MTGSPSTLRSLLVFGIAAAALPGMPAAAQQIERFGAHWIAVCDNTRTCAAYGVHAGPTPGYLWIERAGTADAEPKVVLAVRDPDMPFTLTFEPRAPGILPEERIMPGRNADGYMRIPIETSAEALVAALRTAKAIDFKPIDTQTSREVGPGKIMLTGALAALTWIDAQQQRTGTVTALVERGNKPAAAVPTPPAAPAVAVMRTSRETQPPDPPSDLLVRAKTICPKGGEGQRRSSEWLGDTHVMFGFVCDARGDNINPPNILLAAPAATPTAARALTFRYPPTVAAAQKADSIAATNLDFDRRHGILEMFHRDRPTDDCGTHARWHWTGREFTLALLRVMPVCGGIPAEEWPVLYRTTFEAPTRR
jgi:hypothetical protein